MTFEQVSFSSQSTVQVALFGQVIGCEQVPSSPHSTRQLMSSGHSTSRTLQSNSSSSQMKTHVSPWHSPPSRSQSESSHRSTLTTPPPPPPRGGGLLPPRSGGSGRFSPPANPLAPAPPP